MKKNERERENLEFSMHIYIYPKGRIMAPIFLSFSSETLASDRKKNEEEEKKKSHTTGNIYKA